jgi:ADP-L-glycero-D-manno-heptose 6-epimerase
MIVVTGAAGFIGSNIVAGLNAIQRDDVVAVDNLNALKTTHNLSGLSVAHSLERDALFSWLEANHSKTDAVIHMGACSDTTQTDHDFMMRNNFEYTRRLWSACASHNLRLIYASSAATYGDGSLGYDDKADPRPLKPLNLYGESKQRFDLWALEQKFTPPGWAGLKFFNVYGPRESHKGRMASVAYHLYLQIREAGKARLFKSDNPKYPDGGQMRDFVYVKDAVAAVLHCLSAPSKAINGLFNVGTGRARTFNDLAHAVFKAMDCKPTIEYIPMPADLRGKYQYFTQAEMSKLYESGFNHPIHSLEDGVKDYVLFLQTHKAHQ